MPCFICAHYGNTVTYPDNVTSLEAEQSLTNKATIKAYFYFSHSYNPRKRSFTS